jgi:hypothetical protein
MKSDDRVDKQGGEIVRGRNKIQEVYQTFQVGFQYIQSMISVRIVNIEEYLGTRTTADTFHFLVSLRNRE